MKILGRLRGRKSGPKQVDAVVGKGTVVGGFVERRAVNSYVEIGRDCQIQGGLITETDSSRIVIGNNVFIGGAGTLIDCAVSVSISDDVLISYGCIISDSDNHSVRYSIRKNDLKDWRDGGRHDWTTTLSKPVVIGKGVWIGARSIILKGVELGEGVIVGAGSVVTRSVPPYTIVAGNPARIIREIPIDER